MRQVREALRQFEFALELGPTKEEAQAALYNKACCHAYRYSTAQHWTLQYSTVRYNRRHCSTVQFTIAQKGTPQCYIVPYSAAPPR